MAKANINTAITGCTCQPTRLSRVECHNLWHRQGQEVGWQEKREAALAMPSSAINANRIKINFVALLKISRANFWRQVAKGAKSKEQRVERIMPSSRREGGGGAATITKLENTIKIKLEC